jgi:hypothetical protein
MAEGNYYEALDVGGGDNIKMDLREIGRGGVDWSGWWALVKTVMNHGGVAYMSAKFMSS